MIPRLNREGGLPVAGVRLVYRYEQVAFSELAPIAANIKITLRVLKKAWQTDAAAQ